MKIGRLIGGAVALGVFVSVAVLYAQSPVKGFDFQDSSAVTNRPAADIADTYLFPSPSNSNNVVAVMDVYPAIPAGSGLTTFFDQHVLYQMKFDSKWQSEALASRPTEDLVIQFSVSASANGTQQVFVYGPGAPNQTGTANTLLNGGLATGTGFINKIFTTGSGLTVFAGAREDPFFFNLSKFFQIVPDRNNGSTSPSCLPKIGNGSCPNGFGSTGSDYFANSNVLSIVVEMNKSVIQPSNTGPVVAYWATASTQSGN